jgi:hypothetical protein
MGAKMIRIIRIIRGYEIPGPAWALMLAISGCGIIWKTYVWLRVMISGSPYASPSCLWAVSILYFAIWLFVFLLLMNDGKWYTGIILDALCSGCLLAVAAVLHHGEVYVFLSKDGLGAASWVVCFGACGLVLSNCASTYEKKKNEAEHLRDSRSTSGGRS